MGHHEIGCLNHCPRGGGGGGGRLLAALAVIVAVFIAIGAWKVRHGIETGIDIGLWVAGGVVGLLLVSAITFLIVRIARRNRGVQLWRPAQPEPRQELAYRVTQMGSHRTVRGAIEAPRTEPETDSAQWLSDTDWLEAAPAPAPAPPRDNPRSRAPRGDLDDRNDDARYHSRFR